VYKDIRTDLSQTVPAWPLGLPAWDAPWLALALRTPATTYLTVWRRPGSESTMSLPLPQLRGSAARVDGLYPTASQAVAAWNPDAADLTPTLPTAPSAVLLRLTQTVPNAP
jgi:alpha-galactosidase